MITRQPVNETSRNHTRNQNRPDLSWHSKSLSLANFPNNLLITIKDLPKICENKIFLNICWTDYLMKVKIQTKVCQEHRWYIKLVNNKKNWCRPTNIIFIRTWWLLLIHWFDAESENCVNFYPKNQVFVIQLMPDLTKHSGIYIKWLTLTCTFTTKYTDMP